MSDRRVPFHRPRLGEPEFEALRRVLERGWLTTGPECAAFEEELAAATGAAAAAATSSGTAAMQLALLARDVGPGDEVITTPLSFVATAAAILSVGARPVFADVEARSGNLDPEAVEAALTSRTRALLVVHLGGHPAEMGPLLDLAARRDLLVLQDAAHALETVTDVGPVGAVGDGACLSFYASKNLTTAEGGALVCRDAAVAARARRLRSHGLDRDSRARDGAENPWHYDVPELGLKANLPDLLAALGRAQLERLEDMHEARRRAVARYRARLADLSELILPEEPSRGRHAWHLFSPLLASGGADRRDALLRSMTRRGIGVSVHFRPIHRLGAFAASHGHLRLPKAEERAARSLSLPLHPDITEEEIELVARALEAGLRETGP